MARGSYARAIGAGFTFVVAAIASACGSDTHTADPQFGTQSSAVSHGSSGGCTKTTVHQITALMPEIESFKSTGFVKQCVTGGTPACPSTQDNANACWQNNSCAGTYPSYSGALKYRRPWTGADADYSAGHGGQDESRNLAVAVNHIVGAINANAFAAPLGHSAGSDANYLCDANVDLGSGSVTRPGGPDAPGETWATMLLGLHLTGYTAVKYYDSAMDRILIALEPESWAEDTYDHSPGVGKRPDQQGRNWGLFIFNTHPTSNVVIEAPHMGYDGNSEIAAAEAFEQGDALALFLPGAHRGAIDAIGGSAAMVRESQSYCHANPTLCQCGDPGTGATGRTNATEIKGRADVAHQASCLATGSPNSTKYPGSTAEVRSGFQVAHEALLTGVVSGAAVGYPWTTKYIIGGHVNAAVVQFHGYDDDTSAAGNAILGSGICNSVSTICPDGAGSAPTGPSNLTIAVRDAINAVKFETTGASPVAPPGTPGSHTAGSTVGMTAIAAQTRDATNPGGLEGVRNVQGLTASQKGYLFEHVEIDRTGREVYDNGTYVTSFTTTDPTAINTTTKQWPLYPKIIGKTVVRAVDDYLADMSWAMLPTSIRNAAAWMTISDRPVFGFDNNIYPDPAQNCAPGGCANGNDYVANFPNDSTLLAMRHRSNVRFVGHYMWSPYFGYNNSGWHLWPNPDTDPTTEGVQWAGHARRVMRAGLQALPIWYGPYAGWPTSQDVSIDIASMTTMQIDADADAAVARAAEEGFGPGSWIFLDVEQSGITSMPHLQSYISEWVQKVNADGYVGALYVSVSDATLVHGLTGVSSAPLWVHNTSCSVSPGCHMPQVGDPNYSVDVSAYWPSSSGTSAPVAMWQYAQDPADGEASACPGYRKSSNPGVIPADPLGTDWSMCSPVTGNCECWLTDRVFIDQGFGDFIKYDLEVDLDSMDKRAQSTAPKYALYKRFPFGTISLGSDAATLSSYVNNPGQVSLSTTAQSLGLDPQVVTTWLTFFQNGGSRVIDNILVDNTAYTDNPQPPQPISNGDFESSTLTAWSSTGSATNISMQGPWPGARVAQLGATTATYDSTLSQTFTVPPTGYPSLVFAYQMHCPDTIQYDQFWVTLTDNTTNTTNTIFQQVCTNTGLWVQTDTDVSAYAGHSVTLTFHNHDDGNAYDPSYTWIDNVALSAIANGGFEQGSLTGWTASGWTGADAAGAAPAVDGAFVARVGSTGPSIDSSLSQSFLIPTFGVSTLSFTYKIICPDQLRYDQVWVTLTDTTTNTSYEVLAQTCTNTGAWSNLSYDVSNLAGHNVKLTLYAHDDDYSSDPTYALFDNFALK